MAAVVVATAVVEVTAEEAEKEMETAVAAPAANAVANNSKENIAFYFSKYLFKALYIFIISNDIVSQ